MTSVYKDLPLLSNDIRLLTIHPGDEQEPLKCSLAVVPLGDFSKHPEGVYRWSNGEVHESDWQPDISLQNEVQWVPNYEALSYTWGDAGNESFLEINNKFQEPVRASLNSALLALRLKSQERQLWVDALCINQDDLQERSEQVQRMQSIYQRACRTIVWLGEEDTSSNRAMDLLERLGGSQEDISRFDYGPTMDFAGPQFDPCYSISDSEAYFINLRKSYVNGLKLIGLSDLSEDDWTTIEKLFNRPYWTRLWVVQEVASAQVVEIRCGSRSMGWDTLNCIADNEKNIGSDQVSVDWFKKYSEIFRDGAFGKIAGHRQVTRHFSRSLGGEEGSTSFLNLMERFRGFECTDPRDKVYALLGLASVDKNMPLPKPDYSKSVSEVYCTTAKAIIQYTRDLTVLCLAKSYQGVLEHRGLPFWCPDWTRKPDQTPLIHDDASRHTFTASGETLPQGIELNFDEDSQATTVRRLRRSGQLYWHLIPSGSRGLTHGTVCHPEMDIKPLHATGNHDTLTLKGFGLAEVKVVGKRITEARFKNGDWKKTVVQWESLLDHLMVSGLHADTESTHMAQEIKIKSFLRTLYRGFIRVRVATPPGTVTDWLDIYYQHYLIWSGRLQPSEVRNPLSLDPAVTYLFDHQLIQCLKAWTFALSWDGRMLLVPEDAQEKDCVVILFGADVPLLLRPSFVIQSTEKIFYQHIGTVYSSGLMSGEALDIAENEGLPTKEFALF